MRIGIVTYVRTDNYGAELQGYALQRKLNLLGYDAEVLDIDKKDIDATTFREMARKAIIRRIKANPLKGCAEILSIIIRMLKSRYIHTQEAVKRNRQEARESAFREFWKNEITHSGHIKHQVLEEFVKTNGYKALIAGSDQIWNYTRTSCLDPYFLMFAPKGVKKISYAASFSVSKIPDLRKEEYKRLINNIDCISVRENEGEYIVNELTGREAHVVLDPTLLLEKEEWMKVASCRINVNEPYLLTYSLNNSKSYWKIVNEYAKKHNLKIINLRHDFDDKKNPDYQTDVFDAGPREFLHLLANATLVITNSFHGTIFSINFRVPFICILNRISETNSRVESILKNLDLSNRMMYDDDPDFGKSMRIDFRSARQKLEEDKEKSLKFLKDSLGDA